MNPSLPAIRQASPQVLGPQQRFDPKRLSADPQVSAAITGLFVKVLRTNQTLQECEKVYQYAEARLNQLYFTGQQYTSLTLSANGIMDYKPTVDGRLGLVSNEFQKANPFITDYILPVFRGDVNKIASVLSGNVPGFTPAPAIPGTRVTPLIKHMVSQACNYLASHWDIANLQLMTIFTNLIYGTAFSYVNFVTDPGLGTTPLQDPSAPPQMNTQSIPMGGPTYWCPQCGKEGPTTDLGMAAAEPGNATAGQRCPQCEAPITGANIMQPESMQVQQAQPQMVQVPNGFVEVSINSIFAVDMPFLTEDIEKAPWLRRQLDRNCWMVASELGDRLPEALRQRIQQGQSNMSALPMYGAGAGFTDTYRVESRQALYNPTGTRGIKDPNLWVDDDLWVDPAMYEMIPNDPSGNIREQIRAWAPAGARFRLIEGLPTEAFNEHHRDHWSACKSSMGPGIYTDPHFSDYRQGVDFMNDTINMLAEVVEHSAGETVYDGELFPPEYLKTRGPSAANWLKANAPAGRAMGDHFYKIPGSKIEEGHLMLLEKYHEIIREAVGITPALFGGGAADATARGTEIKRNQAMQQLNLLWNNVRIFEAATLEKGVRILSQRSMGKLFSRTAVTGSMDLIEIPEIWQLQKGGWRIQADTGIPMSAAQRRDWMRDLASDQNLQPLLSLMDTGVQLVPQNLPRLQEMLGLSDWYVQGLDEYEHLMEILHQMAMEQPVPGMDQMTGMPQMQPSRPADPLLFNPRSAVATIKGYLHEMPMIIAEQNQDPGYENVRALMTAYLNILFPPLPPMPEGGGDQPGAEGGASAQAPAIGGGESPLNTSAQPSAGPPSAPPPAGAPSMIQ